MEILKLLSANELVAQTICFLMFLAIMRTFLWKKFLAILDKRRENIVSERKTIDDEKEAVLRIRSEYQMKIAEIDSEAKAMVREAAIKAEKAAEGIRSRAQADSERMMENAKANIADELSKAKEELKTSAVDLAIRVAEKVIQEKLTEKSDRRLVEDFIKGIESK